MDKQSKLLYQREVEEYLEKNNIYNLFEDLTKQLIIEQPESPVNFLISKLSEPECQKIFLVGPPGSEVREIALQLCDHLQFNCISVGDLLQKEISKKTEFGQKIQEQIQQFKYVDDELVNQVVINNMKQMEEEKKNVILEGYPKTRMQALRMQKEGIIPYSFIIMNLEQQKIKQGCLSKLKNSSDYQEIPNDYFDLLADAYQQEYNLNVGHVKQVYQNNFYQIEVKDNREEIIENVARLLKYKLKNNAPKRSQKIIVAGPPGSGRTSLTKQLCAKYGFVNISTNQLMKDQIARQTPIGQAIQQQVQQGILEVNDELIISLMNDRLQQIDCKSNGYILDGFPKNINQLYSLEDMRVNPTMVVILEGDEQTFVDRIKNIRIDPQNGHKVDILKQTHPKSHTLVGIASNSDENVSVKINMWKEMLKQFEEKYADSDNNPIFKVNGMENALNVFEKVSFHLENS